MTVAEFDAALKQGKYTSVGSYPLFFMNAEGDALSWSAANKHRGLVRAALKHPGSNRQWEVVAHGVNWEDPNLFCSHTDKRIESAYAEDQAASSRTGNPTVRKHNPGPGVAVAIGAGALIVGALGWFAYKSYKPSTSPTETKLAALPAFDPASTDPDRGVFILVYTTKPVSDAEAESALEQQVAPFLRSLSLDRIQVFGPSSKDELSKLLAPGGQLETEAFKNADAFVMVTMDGKVKEIVTKEQMLALKKLMASGV